MQKELFSCRFHLNVRSQIRYIYVAEIRNFAGFYFLWLESIKIIIKKANDKVMSAEKISTTSLSVWLSFDGLGS